MLLRLESGETGLAWKGCDGNPKPRGQPRPIFFAVFFRRDFFFLDFFSRFNFSISNPFFCNHCSFSLFIDVFVSLLMRCVQCESTSFEEVNGALVCQVCGLQSNDVVVTEVEELQDNEFDEGGGIVSKGFIRGISMQKVRHRSWMQFEEAIQTILRAQCEILVADFGFPEQFIQIVGQLWFHYLASPSARYRVWEKGSTIEQRQRVAEMEAMRNRYLKENKLKLAKYKHMRRSIWSETIDEKRKQINERYLERMRRKNGETNGLADTTKSAKSELKEEDGGSLKHENLDKSSGVKDEPSRKRVKGEHSGAESGSSRAGKANVDGESGTGNTMDISTESSSNDGGVSSKASGEKMEVDGDEKKRNKKKKQNHGTSSLRQGSSTYGRDSESKPDPYALHGGYKAVKKPSDEPNPKKRGRTNFPYPRTQTYGDTATKPTHALTSSLGPDFEDHTDANAGRNGKKAKVDGMSGLVPTEESFPIVVLDPNETQFGDPIDPFGRVRTLAKREMQKSRWPGKFAPPVAPQPVIAPSSLFPAAPVDESSLSPRSPSAGVKSVEERKKLGKLTPEDRMKQKLPIVDPAHSSFFRARNRPRKIQEPEMEIIVPSDSSSSGDSSDSDSSSSSSGSSSSSSSSGSSSSASSSTSSSSTSSSSSLNSKTFESSPERTKKQPAINRLHSIFGLVADSPIASLSSSSSSSSSDSESTDSDSSTSSSSSNSKATSATSKTSKTVSTPPKKRRGPTKDDWREVTIEELPDFEPAKTRNMALTEMTRSVDTIRITLEFLMMGIWFLRIPVLPRDLVDWVATGRIPYLTAYKLLPTSISYYKMLKPSGVPESLFVVNNALEFVDEMQLEAPLPPINAVPILTRMATLLEVPPEVEHAAARLLSMNPRFNGSFEPTNHPYENVMAHLIIALKMLYRFDDTYALSPIALRFDGIKAKSLPEWLLERYRLEKNRPVPIPWTRDDLDHLPRDSLYDLVDFLKYLNTEKTKNVDIMTLQNMFDHRPPNSGPRGGVADPSMFNELGELDSFARHSISNTVPLDPTTRPFCPVVHKTPSDSAGSDMTEEILNNATTGLKLLHKDENDDTIIAAEKETAANDDLGTSSSGKKSVKKETMEGIARYFLPYRLYEAGYDNYADLTYEYVLKVCSDIIEGQITSLRQAVYKNERFLFPGLDKDFSDNIYHIRS